MKVIVCGGKDYHDYQRVCEELDNMEPKITFVIEGGALGADRLARKWAIERGIEYQTVEANWQKYGRSAGPIRNQAMLDMNPEMVIAFPGGVGTGDMVKRANRKGTKVKQF